MEIVLKGAADRQRLLKPTLKDILLVENLSIRKVKKNAAVNFKNDIVAKPWGIEYLCGRNKNIEVWELYINPQAATSMHCHPNKDTLNIVLEGTIFLETIGKKEVLQPGDFKLLKAGVIHKSINFDSKSRARLLEIESPPNKYDLIRVKDDYGRESLGYVKFRTQKIAGKLMKRYLYSPAQIFFIDKRKLYILRKFIFNTDKTNKSITVYELFIRTMSFKNPKYEILKRLKLAAVRSLICIAGSLSLSKNIKVFKLLPGDCVFDVPLNQFNWSAKWPKFLYGKF